MAASGSDGGGAAVLLVGTYTHRLPHVDGRGQGVYAVPVDERGGSLGVPRALRGTSTAACGARSPSFVAPSGPRGSRRFLAAFEEAEGAVAEFELAPDASDARLLAAASPSGGADPCHVLELGGGGGVPRLALLSNYSGGTLGAVALDGAGAGGLDVWTPPETGGSGGVPERQGAAHMHQAVRLPGAGAARVLAVDLGNDCVWCVTARAGGGLEGRLAARLPRGSGPRHLALSACGRAAYIFSELANTLTVAAVGADGSLELGQVLPTLPDGEDGQGAAVRVAGGLVWVSNRGHDSVASFREAAPGDPFRLEPVAWSPVGARTPRDLAFSPSGRWAAAACQDSDEVALFAVDAAAGTLRRVAAVAVPTPVCVSFLPL